MLVIKNTMDSYAKDQALVAKHAPRERATSSNMAKYPPTNQATTAATSTKKWASTLSAAKYLLRGQRDNGGKASIRDPHDHDSIQEEDTPYGNIHSEGMAKTLLVAKHMSKRG